MNPLERVQVAASHLKVFPLPSAVMFPHAALPLHIFEPRYRDMVKDALETDQVIAIAQMQPGWEVNYHGRPPLVPLCCAGVLAWHESLADGRYNVLLHGASRVRVLEELPADKPYREVRAEVLSDPPYAGEEEELLRRAVLELCVHVPKEVAAKVMELANRLQGGALADVIASTLVSDIPRRQTLLSELDPQRRLRAVLLDVSELMARLNEAKKLGPLN